MPGYRHLDGPNTNRDQPAANTVFQGGPDPDKKR